jgi:spore coat protein U-like protein
MKKALLGSLVAFGLVSGGVAQAATATTTFQSKIIITASCTVTATLLDFGTTGLITANIDAASTMAVTCTNTTPYNVGIDKGVNGASTAARKMKAAGADLVSYSIFKDTGRTSNWGDVVGTDTLTGTGSGVAQTINVYGRVPAQAGVTPATYTDTLTVTVTY